MIQLQLTLDEELPELQTYSVRVSNRARSVSLRVIPEIGLEVTIPRRFNRSHIPEILRDNRRWIEKALDEVERNIDPKSLLWPPADLELKAIGCSVPIVCTTDSGAGPDGIANSNTAADNRYYARYSDDAITVRGPDTDRKTIKALIEKLLKNRARQHLAPIVSDHAEAHGIVYKRLVVRGQKTLWGSYSNSGTLSLNYKLLFLRPELVQYVVLHELAHVRHLNHSPAFWNYLESLQPGAKELDAELDIAAKTVPRWLENRR